jgi:methionyl-tRNA synthetase
MAEKFYVTTPIYYPNDVPHIGHAYTTIVADVLARWNSLQKKDVFFLTGTDDHGKKIAETAKSKNKSPKEFVDELVPAFKDAWKKLNIQYDRFIRTTDGDHEKIIQEVLQKIWDKDKNKPEEARDIYLGEYEGLYCVGCEAYYTEKDLEDGCCPIHKKKVDKVKEESYFFRLSKYKDRLLELYKRNPEFISPDFRKNEIVNRVEEGLRDLSISRTSFDWGVPLPFDEKHVCYVWFDALFNYYSATRGQTKDFWPADVQLIGKDILWFHTVYWPAFLMSAGIELPKKIFAHGWWTFDKEKISKSRGKVINVDELIAITGNVDSVRYFLCRETPFGEDGDFSKKTLIDRHNGELANKLGNLVSRVSGLIEKYGVEKTENSLNSKLNLEKINKLIEELKFDKSLDEIFSFIDICNEYVQNKKPWETEDKKVLYELKESILKIAELLEPFIPDSAEKIKEQFSQENIKKEDVLFKKIEWNKQQNT